MPNLYVSQSQGTLAALATLMTQSTKQPTVMGGDPELGISAMLAGLSVVLNIYIYFYTHIHDLSTCEHQRPNL